MAGSSSARDPRQTALAVSMLRRSPQLSFSKRKVASLIVRKLRHDLVADHTDVEYEGKRKLSILRQVANTPVAINEEQAGTVRAEHLQVFLRVARGKLAIRRELRNALLEAANLKACREETRDYARDNQVSVRVVSDGSPALRAVRWLQVRMPGEIIQHVDRKADYPPCFGGREAIFHLLPQSHRMSSSRKIVLSFAQNSIYLIDLML
jgi:hypothetical protein